MVPDMMVLCVIVMFGVNVVQRIYHVVRHDPGRFLRSIYERSGLLLDTIILGLQILSKPQILRNLKASYAALMMRMAASLYCLTASASYLNLVLCYVLLRVVNASMAK